MNIESVIQMAAAVIVLYVSYRLNGFETRIMDKLNGRYLRREEAELLKDANQRDHERFDKSFTEVWERINAKERP